MKSVSTTFPKPDTSHYWQSLQTSQARVTNEARTHTDIITPEIAPCLLDASRHNACIVLWLVKIYIILYTISLYMILLLILLFTRNYYQLVVYS